MAQLSLSLCGHVTARLDGALPSAPRLGSKAVALIAYLAVERGHHTRSALASLLWGEHTDDHARTSLRQTIAQIRRTLGPVIDDDGGALTLAGAPSCDVDPLLDDSRSDGGDIDVSHFLTELEITGAPEFEEWASLTREKLRVRATGRLSAEISQALARHDVVKALGAAERWVALATLDEAPAIAVAHVLEQAGRPAEGLARLEAHAVRAQAELGRQPSQAHIALALRLRKLTNRDTDWAATHGTARSAARAAAPSAANEPAAPPVDTAAMHNALGRRLTGAPLQERESEWQILADAWKSAHGGSGSLFLVRGEHGVGTSRLIRDIGRWVTGTGGTVIRVAGRSADRSVPFAVLASLVHATIETDGAGGTDGVWLAELARLDPGLHSRFPGVPPVPGTSNVDGWRIFEALSQVLTVLTSDGPVLMLLDDMPWCDEETAGLLLALIERTRDLPVMWCLAASIGVSGRASAGARLMRTLGDNPRAQTIRPRRLTESGMRGIVDSVGTLRHGKGAESREKWLIERVLFESEGLPLFAIELLHGLFAAGACSWSDETWDVTLTPGEALPLRLVDIDAVRLPLSARLQRLAEDEREVLTTIAVADCPCDVELLSLVNGISRLRVAVLCTSLCTDGLLAEDGHTYVCLSRVVAAVAQAAAGPVMRREVELAVAAVMSSRRGQGESTVQIWSAAP